MEAYPIKFRPILKEKIWGGEKLTSIFNKQSDSKSLGERIVMFACHLIVRMHLY